MIYAARFFKRMLWQYSPGPGAIFRGAWGILPEYSFKKASCKNHLRIDITQRIGKRLSSPELELSNPQLDGGRGDDQLKVIVEE